MPRNYNPAGRRRIPRNREAPVIHDTPTRLRSHVHPRELWRGLAVAVLGEPRRRGHRGTEVRILTSAVAAILVAFTALAGQQAPPRPAVSGTVLITGSNRGL